MVVSWPHCGHLAFLNQSHILYFFFSFHKPYAFVYGLCFSRLVVQFKFKRCSCLVVVVLVYLPPGILLLWCHNFTLCSEFQFIYSSEDMGPTVLSWQWPIRYVLVNHESYLKIEILCFFAVSTNGLICMKISSIMNCHATL